MRNRATRAHDQPDRPIDLRSQQRRDAIKPGAATGRHDDLIAVGKLPRLGKRLDQFAHAHQIGVDLLFNDVEVGPADVPLPARHAREDQTIGSNGCGSHRFGQLLRTGARAALLHAEFDQHPNWWIVCTASRGQTLDAGDRINQQPDLSACPLRIADPAHGRRLDHLVGDQHAGNTEGCTDPTLRGVRDGNRPRARIELATKQLGRHRRLAVRRQRHLVRRAPRLHRCDVPSDRVLADRQERQRHIAAQDIPALGRDRARRGGWVHNGEALVAPVDRVVEQLLEGDNIHALILESTAGR